MKLDLVKYSLLCVGACLLCGCGDDSDDKKSTSAAACDANALRCSADGQAVERCAQDGSQWKIDQTCTYGCDANACKEAPTPSNCEANTRQCDKDNKTLLVCGSDGKWKTETVCDGACSQSACQNQIPGNDPSDDRLEGKTCNADIFKDSCDENILTYCESDTGSLKDQTIHKLDCSEESAVTGIDMSCQIIQGYGSCFPDSLECIPGSPSFGMCNFDEDNYAMVSEMVCVKSENDEKSFWYEENYVECHNGEGLCDADHQCQPAVQCNPKTYEEACAGDYAALFCDEDSKIVVGVSCDTGDVCEVLKVDGKAYSACINPAKTCKGGEHTVKCEEDDEDGDHLVETDCYETMDGRHKYLKSFITDDCPKGCNSSKTACE